MSAEIDKLKQSNNELREIINNYGMVLELLIKTASLFMSIMRSLRF